MTRLEGRVIRLERGGTRNSWRAYIGRPIVLWPDEALHAVSGDPTSWPPEPPPTEAEEAAICARWGMLDDDGDDDDGGAAA
jgi:hypothetical protein